MLGAFCSNYSSNVEKVGGIINEMHIFTYYPKKMEKH